MWKIVLIIVGMDVNLEPVILTVHPPAKIAHEDCEYMSLVTRMADPESLLYLAEDQPELENLEWMIAVDATCVSPNHPGYDNPEYFKSHPTLLEAAEIAKRTVEND